MADVESGLAGETKEKLGIKQTPLPRAIKQA
jgi:hypothetical protein